VSSEINICVLYILSINNQAFKTFTKLLHVTDLSYFYVFIIQKKCKLFIKFIVYIPAVAVIFGETKQHNNSNKVLDYTTTSILVYLSSRKECLS